MKRALLIGATLALGATPLLMPRSSTAWAARAARQPHAAQMALRTLTLYRDGRLAPGWQDWSWTPHVLSVPAPSGLKGRAMSVSYKPWSGIYLHSKTPFDPRDGSITIMLNGGAGGQHLVFALMAASNHLGKQIPLDLYLPYGVLPPRQWVSAQLALTFSLPAGTLAHGIVLQEWGGQQEPVLFIGAITLRARLPVPAHTAHAVAR